MAFCYIPKRFILVLLAHFGFFVVYALRVNLSVALVAMVNSTYSQKHIDPECQSDKNETVKSNGGEFNWNQNEQGLILSSFFYGYLFTQIPGGWLANKFGGKHVFGLGVLGTSILTLLTPLAARGGIYWLIVVRVLEGIGEGVTFPAMHAMVAQWSPPQEIARVAVLSYSGMQTGTIISLPISGILASSSFLGGWPSAFYVFGVVGLVWYVVWMIFVYDSPETHPTISAWEKNYILKSLNNKSSNTKNSKVPWLQFLSSLPVWAITFGHFSHNWVWYMVLTGLPLYFKQVLDFNLKDNGFLSALPFIAAFVVYLIGGVFADLLRRRYLSTVATRRLAGILGFYPASAFLILASYAGCDEIGLSVAYMVLAVMFLSFNNVGFMVNHLDISPRFSGILMGITNFFGTIAGCITPSVTGYYTNDSPTREQYRKVFTIAAIVCTVGGTFFNIFVNGTVQSWNDDNEKGTGKVVNTEDDEASDNEERWNSDTEKLLEP